MSHDSHHWPLTYRHVSRHYFFPWEIYAFNFTHDLTAFQTLINGLGGMVDRSNRIRSGLFLPSIVGVHKMIDDIIS